MSEASTHPPPWSGGSTRRGARSSTTRLLVASTSTTDPRARSDAPPGRCPPFTSAPRAPSATSRRAARRASATVSIRSPTSASASGTLAVTSVARGRSSVARTRTALAPSRRPLPAVGWRTGSTTSGNRGCFRSQAATARTLPADPSAPVFTTCTPWPRETSSSWRARRRDATGYDPASPAVDWTVRTAATAHPNTLAAANARRSAAMPAPPPGSRPEIVSAVGVRMVS